MAVGGAVVTRPDGLTFLGGTPQVRVPIENVFGSFDLSFNTQFGSEHPGGVNLVRGDASTIFLPRDIDVETIARLGGSADGQVVGPY